MSKFVNDLAVGAYTPSADHTNKRGYLVTLATTVASLLASAAVLPHGVILEGESSAAVNALDSVGILGGNLGVCALKAGGTLSITGHEMAEGSKLPLGSVGLSLSKIMAAGAVKRVGRGSYQLGTVAGAAAEATNKSTVAKKAQPAKKAKPAAAKKAKAAPAPVTEAPAAEAAAAPL